MTTAAWITMTLTMTIVTSFAGFFFWKILTTPSKAGAEKGESG